MMVYGVICYVHDAHDFVLAIPRSVQQGVMVIPHGSQDILLIPHSIEDTVLAIHHSIPCFYVL